MIDEDDLGQYTMLDKPRLPIIRSFGHLRDGDICRSSDRFGIFNYLQ